MALTIASPIPEPGIAAFRRFGPRSNRSQTLTYDQPDFHAALAPRPRPIPDGSGDVETQVRMLMEAEGLTWNQAWKRVKRGDAY